MSKLYVKLRESGELDVVKRVENYVYDNNRYLVYCMSDFRMYFELGIDCDLCDEQGRLLVPEQPDLVRHLLETSKPIDPEIGNAVNEVFSEMESPEQPDMIPLEDALKFTEWCKSEAKYNYVYWYVESAEGKCNPNFDTADLYEYWKTNIKSQTP